ncbi:unnamed protein product [Blepharisma stoltei]|uniref:Uncharacterized protein n=1 Tax=Blepharisma stoltei TaxID=1481888 RepID=A0AAU9IED3_9CILI|nr:unnamed protein product [Blepharisma stoltei]
MLSLLLICLLSILQSHGVNLEDCAASCKEQCKSQVENCFSGCLFNICGFDIQKGSFGELNQPSQLQDEVGSSSSELSEAAEAEITKTTEGVRTMIFLENNELGLSENVIYNENILPSEWKFYKVPFYQGHKDIALLINTESSNPQIYISLNANNIKPNLSSNNYSFSNFIKGTLEISLKWDSVAYLNCNSNQKGHYDPSKQCAYHIGVYSPTSTKFDISFTSIPVVPTLVKIGSPITSNMNLYDHKSFYGVLDVNSPSAVKVSNLSGRTSLYVSLFDYDSVGKESTKWPMPYSSPNSFNSSKVYDEIKFGKDYLASICPSRKCFVEICLICWSDPCQAQLSLLNQSYSYMKKDTYYTGSICLNCFHYFQVPFYYGHKNIKVVLTPVSSDVDLYVRLNANNGVPDTVFYDYRLQRGGLLAEEFTLTFDSVAQQNCPVSLSASHEGVNPCVYHVGVYGYSQGTYSLIYYEYDLFDNLRTGSVQVKSIGSSKHGMFYSLLDSNYDASILVDELLAGKMIMSIYDYGAVKKDMSKLPNNLDSKATLIVEKDSDTVALRKEYLKSLCPSKTCLAQICLHCPYQECYPRLQLQQDNELLLEEGKAYRDQVDEMTFKDYKIPFSYGHKTITIVLNVYKGDAEIYISLNDNDGRPSPAFYDYKSNLNSTREEITLTNDKIAMNNCPQLEGLAAHENGEPCYYHIGIYGKVNSVFSVQVYPSSALPKELASNSPKSISAVNTVEDRFFNVMNTEKPARVSIDRISGETLVYVSIFDFAEIGPNSASWPLPNKAKKQYKSRSEYVEEIFIRNDILQEVCPSGLCITLLCSFCMSDACEYQLEVRQTLVADQQGLLVSGNFSSTLVVCIFITALFVSVSIWYYCNKRQIMEKKNLSTLTEALIVEEKKV